MIINTTKFNDFYPLFRTSCDSKKMIRKIQLQYSSQDFNCIPRKTCTNTTEICMVD